MDIGMLTDRIELYDQPLNDEAFLLIIGLLDEKIEASQLGLVKYQNWVARNYNVRIKPCTFKVKPSILQNL